MTDQNNQPSGIVSIVVTNEKAADGSETPVLVAGCNDKALKMWRLPNFERRGIIASRAGHADTVRCLTRGPGNSFFSGSMDQSIIVWEFMTSG